MFESAARHLSFTRAAHEMHVTTGAVSRQIKVLETFLGARLFERVNREVRLTPVGLRYRDELRDVFTLIASATENATRVQRDKPLHIWCQMTFAMRWLLPRMPAFHAAHPGRDATFTTSGVQGDTMRGADVVIRIGEADWPGAVSRRLVDIELVPVCSPRLLGGPKPLKTPADLRHHTLLQSVARPDYWPMWLQARGVQGVDPTHGLVFENVALAYQAALQGLGVAMGQYALVADDLAEGRLVSPFPELLPIDSAFYLIYPERLEHDPHLGEFRDWVQAMAKNPERAFLPLGAAGA